MIRAGRAWTTRELFRARQLKSRMTYQQLAVELGRSFGSVRARLKKDEPAHIEQDERVDVPRNAIEEREHRLLLEPRDLTAAFCGDPLPGYSALERMR